LCRRHVAVRAGAGGAGAEDGMSPAKPRSPKPRSIVRMIVTRLCLAAAAVAFLIWAPQRSNTASEFRTGRGYAAKVDVLIRQELIKATTTPEGLSLSLTAEGLDDPDVKHFRDHSFLGRDMANPQSGVWTIVNGKVTGMDAAA